VLGPLEVLVDRQAIPLDGWYERAVTAVLVLLGNRLLSVGALVEAVGSGEPPGTAGDVVRRSVRLLGDRLAERGASDVLEAHGAGFRLRVAEGELDLHRFEHLVAQARDAAAAGRAGDAALRLRVAFRLWRGPPLDGVPGRLAAEVAAKLAARPIAAAEEVVAAISRFHEPHNLTSREYEIAQLISQGMTNVEIGRHLAISKRTVDSHVDHIKAKLGLTRRVQIVAWAVGRASV
jgi:DNA-binding CsgD family transcriptional regulator